MPQAIWLLYSRPGKRHERQGGGCKTTPQQQESVESREWRTGQRHARSLKGMALVSLSPACCCPLRLPPDFDSISGQTHFPKVHHPAADIQAREPVGGRFITLGFPGVGGLFVYGTLSLSDFPPSLDNSSSWCLPKRCMNSGSHIKINLILGPSAFEIFLPAAPGVPG